MLHTTVAMHRARWAGAARPCGAELQGYVPAVGGVESTMGTAIRCGRTNTGLTTRPLRSRSS